MKISLQTESWIRRIDDDALNDPRLEHYSRIRDVPPSQLHINRKLNCLYGLSVASTYNSTILRMGQSVNCH